MKTPEQLREYVAAEHEKRRRFKAAYDWRVEIKAREEADRRALDVVGSLLFAVMVISIFFFLWSN